jgi:hypothetical protein
MPSSDRLIAIAAHGLAGSRTDLPASPLSDLEWFDLVQACLAADLVGFLAAAAAEGHLPTTPGQGDELSALHAELTGVTVVVERRAATMASLLTAAGVNHRVVDGPARRLAYGDAGGPRHARTVRLLVPQARLADALALLGPTPLPVGGRPVERRERLSIVPSLPGLAPLAATPASDAAPPGEGAPPVLGPGAAVVLADRTVQMLTLEEQLVATCVELATTPAAALVDLRDAAALALSPGLDSLAARRLADANGVTSALAEGVALAWGWFDLADKTELSVWALRMGDRQSLASSRPLAPVSRLGLAQRVFGRVPAPVPAAPASVPASVPAGSARPAGSIRR